MSWPNLEQIASDVNSAKTPAVDNVRRSFDMIGRTKEFDAIISVPESRAMARAKAIDETVAKGSSAGRLAGVPFITKDNFLTFERPTTAASHMLKNFGAPYQATVIEKLEAEGAICVAKANLDAWAHGSSTENSDFFVTKNPYDKTRVPGGSSGGSAAGVALDIAPFALGTETGGSVRLPASFCGLIGFKPTYGLVSRSGIIAMASSTDVAAPFARSVEDLGLVLEVMAGRDELDSTTIERDKHGYQLSAKSYKLSDAKIGVIREYMSDEVEPGVRANIEAAISKFKRAGAQVGEISLPSVDLALAVYYIVCPAEVSSNLARYDGQRYGHSAGEAKNLEESYWLSREQGFGAEAKRRIMIGSHVLSSGYRDAYYKKAQLVRTKIINELAKAFAQFDFLLGPTSPVTAFKIGERTRDPLQMYLSDIMLVAANITGMPSISLPAGTANDLPVGLQIMAPARADRQLLALSKTYEELA